MNLTSASCAAVIGTLCLVPFASGHFKLLEPPSWIAENNLGDPQKLGPCGGTTADPGTATNAISKARGGSRLHLKWIETIYHPGHYRIALAVNSPGELPSDPPTVSRDSDKGLRSVSAVIQNPVLAPVLVDGLFPHTVKPTEPMETDIELPNINCPKCTVQIVQFMAEHGLNKDGGYFYHHCANVQITADPAKPLDTRWPGQK